MARGDGVFARCNVDWPTNPLCIKLKSASAKWLNHVLWLCAVRERREQLGYKYDTRTLHVLSGLDTRTIHDGLAKMQEVGLISMNDEGHITVRGVKSNNSKLKWYDGPPPSPYAPQMGPYGEGEGEGEGDIHVFNPQMGQQVGQTYRPLSISKGAGTVPSRIIEAFKFKNPFLSPEKIEVFFAGELANGRTVEEIEQAIATSQHNAGLFELFPRGKAADDERRFQEAYRRAGETKELMDSLKPKPKSEDFNEPVF